MAKKKKKKRNPVLAEKYEEGRWAGIQQATSYFLERFEELKQTPGIGPKTQKKILEVMFKSYEEKKSEGRLS